MRLKWDELSRLSAVEMFAAAQVHQMGLTAEIRRDWGWLRAHYGIRKALYNPTFDPDLVRLDTNSWWLCLKSRGEMIGCQAIAIFSDDSLGRLMRTGRLWSRDGFDVDGAVAPVADEITGSFSYGGVMWVEPSWRQRRIAFYMTAINRVHILRNHDVRFVTGTVLEEMTHHRMITYDYPADQVEPVFDGSLPFMGETNWYLCHMTADQAMDRIGDHIDVAQAA